MTSTELVLHSPEQAFSLASKIAKSSLVPAAYRGKEADLAIAMMYGAEVGLPPMTTMQRVVVVEGKPTLDAQGFVSLVRSAGHSITGDVTAEKATVKGKRRDNGDEMTVTWTLEHAQKVGLTRKKVWQDYPEAMLWARAVTQLCRMLFSDVTLSFAYTPEELDSEQPAPVASPSVVGPSEPRSRVRPVPGSGESEPEAQPDEIAEAEIVTPATDYSSLSAREITEELKRRNLPVGGTQAERIERLSTSDSPADPETGEIAYEPGEEPF